MEKSTMCTVQERVTGKGRKGWHQRGEQRTNTSWRTSQAAWVSLDTQNNRSWRIRLTSLISLVATRGIDWSRGRWKVGRLNKRQTGSQVRRGAPDICLQSCYLRLKRQESAIKKWSRDSEAQRDLTSASCEDIRQREREKDQQWRWCRSWWNKAIQLQDHGHWTSTSALSGHCVLLQATANLLRGQMGMKRECI